MPSQRVPPFVRSAPKLRQKAMERFFAMGGGGAPNAYQDNAREACVVGDVDELERLRRLGCDLKSTSASSAATLAHYAGQAGQKKVLEYLLESDCAILVVMTDVEGATPLHW